MNTSIINETAIQTMVECANTTCGNSFLMENGDVLNRHQFKKLSFVEKLDCIAVYKYRERMLVKV